jgi:hypothetical protein
MGACKNVYGLWHTMKPNLKIPQRLKNGHLVYFLLSASYNNVYYKYESFFINFLINWS